MRTHRRYRKESSGFSLKVVLPIIIVLTIVVSSFATVMASTVNATVIDGESTYEVSLMSSDPQDIIDGAIEQGMPQLEGKDTFYVSNETAIIIDREILVPYEENNKFSYLSTLSGQSVAEVLKSNGVEIDDNDKVSPDLLSIVTSETSIEVNKETSLTIWADGKTTSAVTYKCTVEEVLEENGIELLEGDKVTPDLSESIEDGMTINVSRLNSVEIIRNGETTAYDTYAKNVSSLIDEQGIELLENEVVTIPENTMLTDGLVITIATEYTVTEEEVLEIDYDTTYKNDSSIYKGETEVEVAGVSGKETVTYERHYKDGELVSEKVISREVTQEPVDAVILKGTKVDTSVPEENIVDTNDDADEDSDVSTSAPTGNTFVDFNGNTVSYSSMISGSCTAYNIPGGTTSTGQPAQVGIVAVNPNIIPYGTKMYITSPAGDIVYGYCVAGDTGGALMSGLVLVDLYYNTKEECFQFGRRNMNVYILG